MTMLRPGFVLVLSGGNSGEYLCKNSNADGDYIWAPVSGGGSPGGSTTQIQYNNAGAFAASADGLYDPALRKWTFSGADGLAFYNLKTNGGKLAMTLLSNSDIVSFQIGDCSGFNNVTYWLMDDSAPFQVFNCKGTIELGDWEGAVSGHLFIIDVPNDKTTSNFKHEASGDITIMDSAKGLVLKDTQATPHYWRFQVDNTGNIIQPGTDIGASPP